MKRIKLFTGLAALLCGLASTSQATFLPPGTAVAFTGTPGLDLQADGRPPGVNVASSLGVPYLNGGLSGTVDSYVVLGDPSNPFGAAYSFYYVVHNTGASEVSRFAVNGFNAVDVVPGVDVKVIPVGGGTSPNVATRSLGLGDLGRTVGFNFTPPPIGYGNLPGSGGLSYTMVVHTSVLKYASSLASIVDGGVSANVAVLAVPEPTTMIAGALLLLPFGASTLRVLRRNRMAVA